jgi:hypothetical protein
MVILLQVGSVKPGGHEVIFQGHFQGPNVNQYQGTNLERQSDHGHYRYLSGHVYLLNRNQWAAYVAAMVQKILEFLEI